MARERLYAWNGERPEREQSGQAAIVLRGLMAEPGVGRTGKEWAEVIGPQLKTRQDPYRVVLYYILILKSKGCVRTDEKAIDAVTRTEAGKHAITVLTEGTVKERERIVEPETPASEEVAAVA